MRLTRNTIIIQVGKNSSTRLKNTHISLFVIFILIFLPNELSEGVANVHDAGDVE